MAITNRIGSILIEGIERVAAFDKRAPYGLAGELEEIIDFSLSDEQEKADLRAGLNNPIIYTKYGNRTITINLTNGTLSTSLLKLLTGTSATIKTSTMPKREKGIAVSGTKATLSETPAVGKPISIFTTDAYGRNLQQLKVGTPASDPASYSINGKDITVHSSVTNPINVWYEVSKEVEEISGKGGISNTYKLEIACIWHDVTTQLKYSGVIVVDGASLTPNYSISGKNSNDVPDPQSVEFTVLTTIGKEPYTIKYAELV